MELFKEGGEGSNLPNCQTNLVIALHTLSLLFCKFVNTTGYHLDRYEPTPPSTKELLARSITTRLETSHPRSFFLSLSLSLSLYLVQTFKQVRFDFCDTKKPAGFDLSLSLLRFSVRMKHSATRLGYF